MELVVAHSLANSAALYLWDTHCVKVHYVKGVAVLIETYGPEICVKQGHKHKLGELIELRPRPAKLQLGLFPRVALSRAAHKVYKLCIFLFFESHVAPAAAVAIVVAVAVVVAIALEPHLAKSGNLSQRWPGLAWATCPAGSNWVLRVVTLHRNGSKLNCH